MLDLRQGAAEGPHEAQVSEEPRTKIQGAVTAGYPDGVADPPRGLPRPIRIAIGFLIADAHGYLSWYSYFARTTFLLSVAITKE